MHNKIGWGCGATKCLIRELIQMKIKINACPTTGKTTFVKKYKGVYRGIELIDFDDVRRANAKKSGKRFLEVPVVKSDILTDKQNVCLLGAVEDPLESDVIYVAVLLPEKELFKRFSKRKRDVPKTSPWGLIYRRRVELAKHSEDNGIPVFVSIKEALDYVIDNFSDK